MNKETNTTTTQQSNDDQPTVVVINHDPGATNFLKDVVNQAPELNLVDDIATHSVDPAEMVEDLADSTIATVEINPDTGERKIVSMDDTEACHLSEEEEKEIEDRIAANMEALDHLDLTVSDIKGAAAEFPDFDMGKISDLAAYKLIDLIKKAQNGENVNVYRELPEEIKKLIDREAAMNGLGGYSIESKTARNTCAEMLVSSFINHLQLQKCSMDLQNELTKINNEAAEAIIGFTLDHQEERHKIYEKYEEKYEKEGDFERAELIRKLLDTIHDAFTLDPMKEAARNHKIKVKKFDIEKPSRAIGPFLLKYEKSEKNIHSLYNAMKVLYRNTREDEPLPVDDIYLFFVAFAKFCRNYSVDNALHHAFMYYVIYNCMMLDFKGADGKNQEFTTTYIANIKEVISLVKGNK